MQDDQTQTTNIKTSTAPELERERASDVSDGAAPVVVEQMPQTPGDRAREQRNPNTGGVAVTPGHIALQGDLVQKIPVPEPAPHS